MERTYSGRQGKMTMQDIQGRLSVRTERYSFYRIPNGTLRFAEHSPETFHPDKQLCNCTKNVSERPSGKPDSIQQYIKFEQNLGRYTFELSLDDRGFPWFKFWWKAPAIGWKFKDTLRDKSGMSQAYFMSDVNDYKGNIKVQVDIPGYGLTDCFFGNVYFGNKVDISTLMNGHSPSRIIDLQKIPDDQVWAHGCNWGREAMIPFSECPETDRWRHVKEEIDTISRRAAAYNQDLVSTVDGLRLQVWDDSPMINRVVLARDWFVHVLDNLNDTEMFRVCAEIDQRIEKRNC